LTHSIWLSHGRECLEDFWLMAGYGEEDAAKLYCWNYYILTFAGYVTSVTWEVHDYHLESMEEKEHEIVAACYWELQSNFESRKTITWRLVEHNGNEACLTNTTVASTTSNNCNNRINKQHATTVTLLATNNRASKVQHWCLFLHHAKPYKVWHVFNGWCKNILACSETLATTYLLNGNWRSLGINSCHQLGAWSTTWKYWCWVRREDI